MAFDAHKNLAISTIAVAPSPATSGVSMEITAGHGTRFPAVPFNATVWPANTTPTPANSEIVRVTGIGTDTFTFARAQETGAGGPTARTILVGDQIAATITAKTITDIELWQPIAQVTAATGAQHNFDLNGPNVDLFCTGAAPSFSGLTVQGAAPYAGCQARVWCKGTTAKGTTEDTNSTAAHRIIHPSVAGQIVGLNGCIKYLYDDVSDRWRMDNVEPGTPISISFSAAHFDGGGGAMTWTVASGDMSIYKFIQQGKRVIILLRAADTTVGGTVSTSLRWYFNAATGFTQVGRMFTPTRVDAAGTVENGAFDTNSGSSNLYFVFNRAGNANWVLGTDNTQVDCNTEIEIA